MHTDRMSRSAASSASSASAAASPTATRRSNGISPSAAQAARLSFNAFILFVVICKTSEISVHTSSRNYKKVSPMLVKDVDEATFQKPYFGGKHLDARRPETLRLKCPRRPILTIAPSLSDHGEPCGWIFRSAQTGNHLKIEVSLYRRKDPVKPINNGAHVQTRCYSLWIRDRILCLS